MLWNQPIHVDWTAAPAGGVLHARTRNLGAGAWVGSELTAAPDNTLSGNFQYVVSPQLDTDWSVGMELVWYDTVAEYRVGLGQYLTEKRLEIAMKWLRLLARTGYSDSAALAELNAGGTGNFAPATESLKAIAAGAGSGGGVKNVSSESTEIRTG